MTWEELKTTMIAMEDYYERPTEKNQEAESKLIAIGLLTEEGEFKDNYDNPLFQQASDWFEENYC